MWRPEKKWKNPYKIKEECFGYQEVEPAMNEAFEAGADAMLGALTASGQRVRHDIPDNTGALLRFFDDCATQDGWLVFVPKIDPDLEELCKLIP